jgi:hypothetical protein
MIGNTIDSCDEQEADAGQQQRGGSGEPGDGARDEVCACGVRDDDNAGLQKLCDEE